ncbi:MAG: hypothetical protein B6245_08195 [Desulfobacteraceae bacterium 4572_88]|nr:MAG: hypothetical protein B6245_08195 [Desulfobacteraceae bacterium 4572_88]
MTTDITGLTPGTTYYVRAYATDGTDTAYGAELNFTTESAVAPTLAATTAASSIAHNSASSGGNITDTGGVNVTKRGICWSTSQNPTTSSSKNEDTGNFVTGSFTLGITGLEKGTTYYVRAYATNSSGTEYGSQISFSTLTIPTLSIGDPLPDSGGTSATCQGAISDDGGYSVSERGFFWSTSSISDSADPKDYSYLTQGSGSGSFGSSNNITGLTAGTTYYIRGYATNTAGTALSSQKTFTTAGTPPPEIVTNTSSVSVAEGETATFSVKLSSDPGSNVTVSITRSSGDTDISVQSGASLTFTTENWSTNQTVTLAAAADGDAVSGSATIQASASGLNSKNVTANEVDDDTLSLETDTTAVTVSEGGTATFKVRLTAQPESNATVTVSHKSGDADISVQSGASLTFTTANWGTNQTVTLAAAEDDDTAEGTATVQVVSTGLTSKNVTATEQENDFVTDTATVTVAEEGTATFNVKLPRQPASDVTVTVSRSDGDTDITVQSGASLTFTTDNWSTNQTVTLAAADDDDLADGTATIQISATGWTTKSITATEDDTDVQGINVDPASLDVLEGSTGEFAVSLAAKPDGDVTVTVSKSDGDADISVQSGASLTFTTDNWSTNQTVTLAAAEDDDKDNGTATIQVASDGLDSKSVTATTVQSGASLTFTTEDWDTDQTVTLAAAEEDDAVDGTAVIQLSADDIDTKDVAATEDDNDELLIKADPESVTVPEDDTASFTVQLTAQPSDTVTVTVAKTSGDEDITVTSDATLNFTTENWNTAQTVSVAAAADADADNGVATVELSADGFASVNVTATEEDPDQLSLKTDTTSLAIPEDDTAEFSVYLSAQPSATVTVSVTRTSGDENITVASGELLEFTTENWDAAQAVSVAAAVSDDANHVASLEVSADGYDPITVTVTRIRKGDVNGDGLVDLDDLILALKLLAGISPDEGESVYVEADVDGDGQIGIAEVIHIIGELSQ